MSKFLHKNRDQPESRLSDTDRYWMDMYLSTRSLLSMFMNNREFLAMLAGCVFALHQDMLKAYGFDMRNNEDFRLIAAMDNNKISDDHINYFRSLRTTKITDALKGLHDLYVDSVEIGRPEHIDESDWDLHVAMARARSTAARIWLLTMHANSENDPDVSIGVTTMWTTLWTVQIEELLRYAMMFTGTFFEDVRTDPLNIDDWNWDPN